MLSKEILTQKLEAFKADISAVLKKERQRLESTHNAIEVIQEKEGAKEKNHLIGFQEFVSHFPKPNTRDKRKSEGENVVMLSTTSYLRDMRKNLDGEGYKDVFGENMLAGLRPLIDIEPEIGLIHGASLLKIPTCYGGTKETQIQVLFLGYVVSGTELEKLESKMEAINNWSYFFEMRQPYELNVNISYKNMPFEPGGDHNSSSRTTLFEVGENDADINGFDYWLESITAKDYGAYPEGVHYVTMSIDHPKSMAYSMVNISKGGQIYMESFTTSATPNAQLPIFDFMRHIFGHLIYTNGAIMDMNSAAQQARRNLLHQPPLIEKHKAQVKTFGILRESTSSQWTAQQPNQI